MTTSLPCVKILRGMLLKGRRELYAEVVKDAGSETSGAAEGDMKEQLQVAPCVASHDFEALLCRW